MTRPFALLSRVPLVLGALIGVAHANGRPPVTNGVFFQHDDPSSLYVRTTFGLLISHDDGCSFRWVCEQNIGYGGEFDPKYAIASDGTIFATTFNGLRISRDGGCSFTTATAELPVGAPGRIADIWVDALDLAPTGDVWVATAESGKTNDVYRSTDGGATFTPQGLMSPVIWFKSLAVAPSDAQRVYVAGYQVDTAPAAHLFVTADGGATWSEPDLAGVTFATTPVVRIGAVDASNADHLYLISVGANGANGDRLYRSIDGGATFTPVAETEVPITSVVIRDPQTVLVAAGEGGELRSDDGGATFAAVADAPQLGCLATRPDGTLVGCGANWDPDFMAVAASTDAAAWQKIFRFVELAGPVSCPAGTAERDTCDQELWPTLAAQFAATGPTCGVTPSDPAVDPMEPPGDGGGCCDAGEGSPIGIALLSLAVIGLLVRRSS